MSRKQCMIKDLKEQGPCDKEDIHWLLSTSIAAPQSRPLQEDPSGFAKKQLPLCMNMIEKNYQYVSRGLLPRVQRKSMIISGTPHPVAQLHWKLLQIRLLIMSSLCGKQEEKEESHIRLPLCGRRFYSRCWKAEEVGLSTALPFTPSPHGSKNPPHVHKERSDSSWFCTLHCHLWPSR